MADNNPAIHLKNVLGEIDEELDDLYTDGIISAAIYSKKSAKRLQVYRINAADRHICLQLKVSAFVAVYVPANQRTIFFSRQAEFLSNFIDEHSDIQAADAAQYSLLIDETSFLDVISCRGEQAHVYESLPINEAVEPKDIIHHKLPENTESRSSDKFLLTSGKVVEQRPSGIVFYVEPNSRKMVLSEPFDGARWLRFNAQIAPVSINIGEHTKSELDLYKIRSPYYARKWLVHRTLIELLPARAAAEGGHLDLEQKYRAETFENRPGTGNVIISGEDVDGGYETPFAF